MVPFPLGWDISKRPTPETYIQKECGVTDNMQHVDSGIFRGEVQGSHTFTDKKIQDFSRTLKTFFQDFFGARQCLNIKTSFGNR